MAEFPVSPNAAHSLAIVVNTFNQPDYLARVLNAIARQTRPPQEIMLADDGSEEPTRTLFERWAAGQSCRCQHVWQERGGFRRARILNLAIARANSEYLVFLDGDTVPHPSFLADHCRLARPRTFVQGHRALIQQKGASFFGLGEFASDRRRALLRWQLRGLKHAFRWPRAGQRYRADLRGIRGCNLGIWRSDLVKVNGYNEAFVGWGREDSELAVRLMNAGVQRLDVRGWALCYHLWHPPVSRANLSANEQLLQTALAQKTSWCEAGLNAHLSGPPQDAK
jgi:glycosyltransferase involved in cell wall biosynthesis